MTEWPGDVVICYIRYMVDLDDKNTSKKEQRYWDNAKASEFIQSLRRLTTAV
jgi:hypothetical protein